MEHDINALGPYSFEHLVNALAIKVLGSGHTGFGPGRDGGRDGFFEGTAPYPSDVDRWTGTWYIQSKFHAPNLSDNAQQWLLTQIEHELASFQHRDSKRHWPDIWIVATNVNPSAVPDSGTFDRARRKVARARPNLAKRFHIWGGDKIVALLDQFPEMSLRYRHLLTPGHLIAELYASLVDIRPSVNDIIKSLVINGIEDQRQARLEQAGSGDDSRPGLHRLFVDLPFRCNFNDFEGDAAATLAKAMAETHAPTDDDTDRPSHWEHWRRHPSRAPVWIIKAGPGHGKSTIGQFLCQVQRAALLTSGDIPDIHPSRLALAGEILSAGNRINVSPRSPRIPIYIELKDYAQWFGAQTPHTPRTVASYLGMKLGLHLGVSIPVGTLRRVIERRRWLVVFDGLDEVPSDIKDRISEHLIAFVRDESMTCDMFVLCTTRPQGYAGQFSELQNTAVVELTPLPPACAMECAERLMEDDRPPAEVLKSKAILRASMQSPAIRELMTTPLQAHIIAVIVRGGQRPPERKWNLFRRFFDVILAREASKELADSAIRDLLQREGGLLKDVHNRLGFLLHTRAETAQGAMSSLSRVEFHDLVKVAVKQVKDREIDRNVDTVMRAAKDRLVLINTPDDGSHVRFDIRPLQEFFAAEFLYDGATSAAIRYRLRTIAGDAHWREVTHFLISALVEGNRRSEVRIAAETLRWIDAGGHSPTSRTVSRRVGAGGLVTMRLLDDGVLEPDKTLRHMFSDALDAVGAARNAEYLRLAIGVRGDESRSWLIDEMLRRTREGSRDETIGASVLLWILIGNDDSRATDLIRVWRLHGDQYIQHVMEIQTQTRLGPMLSWQTRFVAEEIRRNQEPKSIRWLASILRGTDKSKVLGSLCKELTDSGSEQASALVQVAFSDSSKYEQVTKDYGWLSFQFVVPSSGTSVERVPMNDIDESNLSGFLRLIWLAARAAETRKREHYVELFRECDRSGWALGLIPAALRERLGASDGRPLADLVNACESSTEPDFVRDVVDRGRLTTSYQMIVRRDEGTLDDFRGLIESHPDWALRVWDGLVGEGKRATLDRPEFIEMVQDLLARNCQHIRMLQPLRWGEWVDKHPSLRQLMVRCFQTGGLRHWLGYPRYGRASEATPVVVDLTTEAVLLLPIAAALVMHHLDMVFGWRSFSATGVDREGTRKECAKAVGAFFPNFEALRSIWMDERETMEKRCAAAALGLVHPGGVTLTENELRPLTLKCAQSSSDLGVLTGAMLEISGRTIKENVREWLSALMEPARIEERSYEFWDSLVDRWRERSLSPLSSFGNAGIESWLSTEEL